METPPKIKAILAEIHARLLGDEVVSSNGTFDKVSMSDYMGNFTELQFFGILCKTRPYGKQFITYSSRIFD